MYTVVDCGECDALWIVADRPQPTSCPRCGTRHRFDRLRRIAEGEDEAAARAARARLLAERSGHGDAFAELGDPADLAEQAEAAGMSDAEYLAGSGLDVEAIEAAGRSAGPCGRGGARSRRSVVTEALSVLDAPSEAEVVAYAAEHGVPEDAASALLERLVQAGAARRDGEGFRPV
jgi:hypothetical protein